MTSFSGTTVYNILTTMSSKLPFLSSPPSSESPRCTPYSWESGPFPLITTPQYLNHPRDPFTKVATHMALLHNAIIRGLNSIYLQAGSVPEAKVPEFITYTKYWLAVVQYHHKTEEDVFFPILEKAAGQEGLMSTNVAQHKEFEIGLEKLEVYLSLCVKNPESYSADYLCEIIDSFAEPLIQHLTDEIPTLESLRESHPHVDMDAVTEEQKKHSPSLGLLFTAGIVLRANIDVEFEGGLHVSFPGWPAFMRWGMGTTAAWSGFSEFACCDGWGRPRELKYLDANREASKVE